MNAIVARCQNLMMQTLQEGEVAVILTETVVVVMALAAGQEEVAVVEAPLEGVQDDDATLRLIGSH